MTAWQFRQLIEEKGNLAAAREVDPSVVNKAQADLLIFRYVMRLLNAGKYEAAGLVLWGPRVWNPKPKQVRRVINALSSESKVLVQGAGSQGKSYTVVGWLFLDWLRDPKFTNIKIISATKHHAASNTFSTLVDFFRNACIKLPGTLTSDYLGLDVKEKNSGIAIIAVPIGDNGKGRLQGFHPKPRPEAHPTLGTHGRVRAFMDECEEVPVGVWEGVANMLTAKHGHERIKVIGAYNPKDQSSRTAENAEPKNGWDSFDLENGVEGKDEWVSKKNWFVIRIDGRKTENVQTRQEIFPSAMSYEGYRELELLDGGNSVAYYTFARGAYPPEGAIGVIISSKLWADSHGEYVFVGVPIKAAGVDTALDGRDNCVLTVGKVGMASAFRRHDGTVVKFKQPRMVAQMDQQYVLKKGNITVIGNEIIATCRSMGISGENLAIDATGNGAAVWAFVRTQMGDDVIGVEFGKNATETKILEEDAYTADELYERLVSEVWFAVARWLEFGYLSINPAIRKEPLAKEVTSRRYVLGAGRKMKVETKDDYKKRMGSTSPDYADSATVFLHGIRMRNAMMGSMVEEKKPEDQRPRIPQHDAYVKSEWVDAV